MDQTFHFLPQSASTQSPAVDALTVALLAVTLFFTLLIAGLVIYFALRYRRKAVGPRALMQDPGHSKAALTVEVVWTVIPLIMVVFMFLFGAHVFVRMVQAPASATEIHVVGKQWMWTIQHPTGAAEKNYLHVPMGQPVKLILTSEDVIHDFAIPAFRIKQDVIPGRYTSEWFQATKAGKYHIFCDQYCGAGHDTMIGTVEVMEPAQYTAWLAGHSTDESPQVMGEKLFAQYGCVTCHASRGPTMAGLYGRMVDVGNGKKVLADEEYLRGAILEPTRQLVNGYQPIMPSFKAQLTEEQVIDLIAYIKSLSGANNAEPYKLEQSGAATQPNKAVPGPLPFLPNPAQ
jgi:cytochrome c oxidase subunit 2